MLRTIDQVKDFFNSVGTDAEATLMAVPPYPLSEIAQLVVGKLIVASHSRREFFKITSVEIP
jgi:hypothetical protein